MSEYQYQAPVVLETVGEKKEAVIIWLHGLGADGNDFVPIVKEMNLKNLKNLKFIFPHAPLRAITLNHGAVMPGWYDIKNLSITERADEQGVRESTRYIHELIEKEHALGMPYEKIMLAGFSQGGAIALYAGLTFQQKLAGVIALSTYVPLPGCFEKECTNIARQTPILMVHGVSDSIIALSIAQASRQLLDKMNYSVEFLLYPMDHTVCMEEIKKIAMFIENAL
jgi:phospholipase/carboxylesterase